METSESSDSEEFLHVDVGVSDRDYSSDEDGSVSGEDYSFDVVRDAFFTCIELSEHDLVKSQFYELSYVCAQAVANPMLREASPSKHTRTSLELTKLVPEDLKLSIEHFEQTVRLPSKLLTHIINVVLPEHWASLARSVAIDAVACNSNELADLVIESIKMFGSAPGLPVSLGAEFAATAGASGNTMVSAKLVQSQYFTVTSADLYEILTLDLGQSHDSDPASLIKLIQQVTGNESALNMRDALVYAVTNSSVRFVEFVCEHARSVHIPESMLTDALNDGFVKSHRQMTKAFLDTLVVLLKHAKVFKFQVSDDIFCALITARLQTSSVFKLIASAPRVVRSGFSKDLRLQALTLCVEQKHLRTGVVSAALKVFGNDIPFSQYKFDALLTACSSLGTLEQGAELATFNYKLWDYKSLVTNLFNKKGIIPVADRGIVYDDFCDGRAHVLAASLYAQRIIGPSNDVTALFVNVARQNDPNGAQVLLEYNGIMHNRHIQGAIDKLSSSSDAKAVEILKGARATAVEGLRQRREHVNSFISQFGDRSRALEMAQSTFKEAFIDGLANSMELTANPNDRIRKSMAYLKTR